ncbi:MAG TPA: cyclic nucleotide-binding domain-containing protein [Alphaproteobacteria bacterium]|nr:cyclic nucleotide-binding domain-containing protein [Alphaproteobacteria bacterium]
MYIKQSALFWDMDKDFVKDLMGIAVRETYQPGDFLFREGDPADYFYILIKGRVKLTVGETGPVVYTVDRAGEAFGWSSLIGREIYSASGECLEPTVLDNFHRGEFHKVIEKYPGPGLIFFKRIAGLIGNRLLWSYKMITSTAKSDASTSFGSGQMQESEAAA